MLYSGHKEYRIRIDECMSMLNKLTGIGNHSITLAHELEKICCYTVTNCSYLHYLPRTFRRLLYIIIANIHVFIKPVLAVYYYNYYALLLERKTKRVIDIHGLTALKFAKTFLRAYCKHAWASILTATQRANLKIT